MESFAEKLFIEAARRNTDILENTLSALYAVGGGGGGYICIYNIYTHTHACILQHLQQADAMCVCVCVCVRTSICILEHLQQPVTIHTACEDAPIAREYCLRISIIEP